MFGEIAFWNKLFVRLYEMDLKIVQRAAAAGCAECGGPLYRSDYPRKPRGGGVPLPEELFGRRFSLCCGREGCRRRATPPSVRFLGRRVYVGVVVLVASVVLSAMSAAAAVRESGVALRTMRRWSRWWQGPFTATRVFVELCGRLSSPLSTQALPVSLLERLAGTAEERVGRALALVAPLTTSSMPEPARSLRGLA